MLHLITFLQIIFLISINTIFPVNCNEFCEKPDAFSESEENCGFQQHYSRNRYILYDVNPPEGFNLRRDVYVRVAVFLKNLVESDKNYKWHLVLPPWGDLYHWRSHYSEPQKQLPWSTFFDVPSLQKYVPVIEMYTFFKDFSHLNQKPSIDCVYILQNDEEMFKTGHFVDKNEIVECPMKGIRYKRLENQEFSGYFWGYSNITAKQLKCIKFHGMMSNLEENLNPDEYRSVMFDHMEIPLHDYYGSQEYWRARRSMRYSPNLYRIANLYRQKYLNSSDEYDQTERPSDWTKEQSRRNAVGGPYLSVHLRRRDFLVGRAGTVPTINNAASQLREKLNANDLQVLFVATDAEEHEFEELRTLLAEYKVLRFMDSEYGKPGFKDGEIAIIDQIICSYARYFIGTYESTFTFRIQEDREIIGFPPERTFNTLCKKKSKCASSGQWQIVW